MKIDLNHLSWLDRKKLQTDAHIRAISAVIRDDIKVHPRRAALYAAYVGAMLTPLPYAAMAAIPMLPEPVVQLLASVPLLGQELVAGLTARAELSIMAARGLADAATFGWINRRLTPWAATISKKLHAAGADKSIVRNYRDYVEPALNHVHLKAHCGQDGCERLEVRNAALIQSTLRQLWRDACDATDAVFHQAPERHADNDRNLKFKL